jgi:hypothetical protein
MLQARGSGAKRFMNELRAQPNIGAALWSRAQRERILAAVTALTAR